MTGRVVLAVACILAVSVAAMTIGPAGLAVDDVFRQLAGHLPGVDLDPGLSSTQRAIIEQVRLPRLVLGLMVGGLLAMSGAAYQGAFRNPLADPYLLGIAIGAGLGATITHHAGDR
ncbi:MAG: iron chelate uptake ABC transporter family permease subunit [Acidimicrobiales bacterium]